MEDAFKTNLDARKKQNQVEPHTEKAWSGTEWIHPIRNAKPIVAAVNGPAVGIGVSQILPMDMIIASTAAKFGFFFVKVGLVPDLGSSHFLVSRVGFGKASELIKHQN